MNIAEMTEREKALLVYFYTVSMDRKVKAAGLSPEKLLEAIYACLVEDFPVVVKVAFRGMVRLAGDKVSSALVEKGVHPALSGLVGDMMGRLEEAFSFSPTRKKR